MRGSHLHDLMEHAGAELRIPAWCRQHDLLDRDFALRTATLFIQQRVPHHAPEPSLYPCRIPELVGVLQGAHDRTMQDVFSVQRDPTPPPHQLEEVPTSGCDGIGQLRRGSNGSQEFFFNPRSRPLTL